MCVLGQDSVLVSCQPYDSTLVKFNSACLPCFKTDDPQGKKIKPFQQWSLCFSCEKSSLRISLKSMLAGDIHTHSTLQWAGDPSFFCVASGTSRQEKAYNRVTSDVLVEESGRDSTKRYRRFSKDGQKRQKYFTFSCGVILLTEKFLFGLMLWRYKLVDELQGKRQLSLQWAVCGSG